MRMRLHRSNGCLLYTSIGNFGNQYHPDVPNKKVLCNFVRVDEEELEAIREIAKKVPIYNQNLPANKQTSFNNA